MKGGFVHNVVLAAPVETAFTSFGARVTRESPAGGGFIDLHVEQRGLSVACEIELGPRRIGRDIRKAISVQAALLLIIVPTASVRRAVLRSVRRQKMIYRSAELQIAVLTLGAALQRVANCCDLLTALNALQSSSRPCQDAPLPLCKGLPNRGPVQTQPSQPGEPAR